MKEEGRNGTYSCASLTSPVIAEKPRYGFAGIETPLTVKQSSHWSPVTKRAHQHTRTLLILRIENMLMQRGLTSLILNLHIQNRILRIGDFELRGDVRPTILCLRVHSNTSASFICSSQRPLRFHHMRRSGCNNDGKRKQESDTRTEHAAIFVSSPSCA